MNWNLSKLDFDKNGIYAMDESTIRNRLRQAIETSLDQAELILLSVKSKYGSDALKKGTLAVRPFASALASSLKWAKELKTSNPALSKEIDEFTNSLPEAKNLRDMLEHEDDYLKGKGKEPTRFKKDMVVNKGKQFVKGIMPQVIMVVNEGVFVGGKVNVGNAVQHLRLLYKNLVNTNDTSVDTDLY